MYKDPAELVALIKNWAQALGFSDAGIAHMQLGEDAAHLQTWLAEGYHGQMQYMQREFTKRCDPAQLQPGTVSVISVRMDYRSANDFAESVLTNPQLGYLARYALGRDYHKVLRSRLVKLGEQIAAEIGPHGFRVLTDSAPSLEKALARNAHLGWIGKNTLIINRHAGSWFFLGEIYTDMPLPTGPLERPRSHCGSCSACMDVCPTGAFVGPYRLDARKCISYLTIEHRGSFPLELRKAIGNRVFGCDDCQLVCPWNRYAQATTVADFAPRHGLQSPDLLALFEWDEATFLQKTEGMALRRLNYSRWLRNIAIALGNAPYSAAIVAALSRKADFPDDAVQEHIAWALAEQAQAASLAAAPAPICDAP